MKTKLLYVFSTATANRADGSAKRPYAMLEAHGSGGNCGNGGSGGGSGS
jgi:hypothetical protein